VVDPRPGPMLLLHCRRGRARGRRRYGDVWKWFWGRREARCFGEEDDQM
jgi:hypothetical protein